MPGHSVMSKIHVWLGVTAHTPGEFSQYFEINAADREAGRGASLFDQDVGTGWYDDDLIGVYRFERAISLEAAADELPTSPEVVAAVLRRCSELEITQANALFYYQDADLHIADTFRLYNGLPYLGVFDDP